MRSNQSRNRNLGINSSSQSAKQIVRDSDRNPLYTLSRAFRGYVWRLWSTVRETVCHLTTVTRLTRVTGGTSGALALAGSGRHAMCRLAA